MLYKTEQNCIRYIYISLKFTVEFNDWKEKEELATSTRYVQHRGLKTNLNKTVTTKYYCHRSGIYITIYILLYSTYLKLFVIVGNMISFIYLISKMCYFLYPVFI